MNLTELNAAKTQLYKTMSNLILDTTFVYKANAAFRSNICHS